MTKTQSVNEQSESATSGPPGKLQIIQSWVATIDKYDNYLHTVVIYC